MARKGRKVVSPKAQLATVKHRVMLYITCYNVLDGYVWKWQFKTVCRGKIAQSGRACREGNLLFGVWSVVCDESI